MSVRRGTRTCPAAGPFADDAFTCQQGHVPADRREALARDIARNVRERLGDPVAAPMVTQIATARA